MNHLRFIINAVLVLLCGHSSYSQMVGVSFEVDTIFGEGAVDSWGESLEGYVTFDLFADFSNPLDELSAIYSDEFALGTSSFYIDAPCGCYNPALGDVLTGGNQNEVLFEFFPSVEYDTYWTLGFAEGEQAQLSNSEYNSLSMCSESENAGVIFTLTPNAAGDDLKLQFAQITTCGPFEVSACFQVFVDGVMSPYQEFCLDEEGGGNLFIQSPFLGCTDSTACNYDGSIFEDDGSCVPSGCLDPDAVNYNSDAGCDNGTCVYGGEENCGPGTYWDVYELQCLPHPLICGAGTYWNQLLLQCLPFDNCPEDLDGDGQVAVSDLLLLLAAYSDICPVIEGCTDSDALNFNPNAEEDDGSCVFEVLGCIDEVACNYEPLANTDDGSCQQLDSCGICGGQGPLNGYDCAGECLSDEDGDGVCDEFEVNGCTNEEADNYEAAATEDDGSCLISGCTSPVACNFNPAANIDDGSCEGATAGYNCAGDCLNDQDGDGVCDEFEIVGCQDENACNYDSDATDSGECFELDECGECGGIGIPEGACDCSGFYPSTGYDCVGNCLSDEDGDGVCDVNEVVGCMSSSASNYDQAATTDDGSCYWDNSDFLGLSYEVVAIDGIDGYTTYRVYANFSTSIWQFSMSGGETLHPWVIFTSNNSLYNHPLGGNLGHEINSAAFEFFPEMEYDSWVALGLGPDNVLSGFSSVGMSQFWEQFNSNNNVEVFNCQLLRFGPINPNSLLIGQFTTSGYLSIELNLGFIISSEVTYLEDIHLEIPLVTCFDVDEDEVCDENDDQIDGCIDESACNFLAGANTDDGSCVFPPEFYDCNGNCIEDNDFDGVCDELEVLGCTDELADNFSSNATDDDGSCEIAGCIITIACNYNPLATYDDGSCNFYCPGCTNLEACNFDDSAIQDDGSCLYPIDVFGVNYVNCEGECLNDADGDGICLEAEVYGCTDSGACNFWTESTEDDGSCEYVTCSGCLESGACNYDPSVLIGNNELCEYESCAGCMDDEACNFDIDATIAANETCEYESCAGCMYEFACNYDPEASIAANETCEFGTCPGCTNPGACNYNPTVTEDDGSCYYVEDGYDCEGACLGVENSCGCDQSSIDFQEYTYEILAIGNQCWFAENLRTENYANGEAIPGGLTSSEWENTLSGAQSFYNFDSSLLSIYGRLYNWYAVVDERHLCPIGWHVPSDIEWMILEMELGMSESEVQGLNFRGTDQGDQMKATYLWNGGNGSNSSGFSGLPGGRRTDYGSFLGIGNSALWWSSSVDDAMWFRSLINVNSSVYRNSIAATNGFSVRCLKDSE